MTFTIARNDTSSARTCTITFTKGNESIVYTIYQSAASGTEELIGELPKETLGVTPSASSNPNFTGTKVFVMPVGNINQFDFTRLEMQNSSGDSFYYAIADYNNGVWSIGSEMWCTLDSALTFFNNNSSIWSLTHNLAIYRGGVATADFDRIYIYGIRKTSSSSESQSAPSYAQSESELEYNERPSYAPGNGENEEPATRDVPTCLLYQHQAGDYCNFFGVSKPFWMTLVANPDFQRDKIFTNLEFRAVVDGEGNEIVNQETLETRYVPYIPVNSLETWNEYQHGIAALRIKNGQGMFLHHLSNNTAHLARKFRIWRCDIPRDNYNNSTSDKKKAEEAMGIFRNGRHAMDRMRNPWLYMKLLKTVSSDLEIIHRTELHDFVVTYFD